MIEPSHNIQYEPRGNGLCVREGLTLLASYMVCQLHRLSSLLDM